MAINKVDVSPGTVSKKTQTRVSKNGKDKVQWDIPSGGTDFDWLVVFPDESPFTEYFFHKGNKVTSESVVPVDPNKQYKYILYLNAAFYCDPTIVIV